MNSRATALNELWAWTRGPGSHFTHKLFDLIAKADGRNRANLRRAFPDEVELFESWMNGTEYEVFYRHKNSLYPEYRSELERILNGRGLEGAYRRSVPQISLHESIKRGLN